MLFSAPFLESVSEYIEEVEGGFSCSVCAKVMRLKHDAVRHVKMQHVSSAEERVTCQHCGKTLKHRWALGDHMRKTHGLSAKMVREMQYC